MSEEEKKAIDIVENIKFKKYAVYIAEEMRNEIRFYQTEEEQKAIDIVLNLIKKLQKEIECFETEIRILHKDNLTLLKEGKETENLNYKYIELPPIEAQEYKSESYIKDNYISKDKIREKLNYFENSFDYDDDGTSYELVMEVLDELLEEK